MMRHTLLITALAFALWPSTSTAQNREHLQMNADLRMLQEHVNRLQLSVNRLDAQLADTNKRIDTATAASVKGFADQQLLINQMAATLSSVRERLDDNSVRVSQLGQEFTAVREGVRRLTEQINTLVGLLQPPVDPGAAPTAATPPGGPGGTPPASTTNAPSTPEGQPSDAPQQTGLAPVILPASAGRIYSLAMGDYMSQRYDSAIEGFREVVETFPTAPDAANAQLMVGEAFTQKKDCRGAIPEYQKFVDTYTDSDRRHEGLFMLGFCYVDINQRTNAQRAFERVVKEYPTSTSAMQATQRLLGMGIKPQ